MNTNTQAQTPVVGNPAGVKFRENAQTAVQRTADGITIHVKGIATAIHLAFAKLHADVRAEAMGYGMEVRLTRAAAIEHAKSGRPATAQERWDAIARLAEHYGTGTAEWAMKSTGGGRGPGQDFIDLVEAVCLALEIDRESAEKQLHEYTASQRTALRMDPEIRDALEIIWKQRSEGVNTQSLKDSLKSLKG